MLLDEETRQALAYYVVMKHPVEFRNFFLPVGWGKPFKTRYYQIPYVLLKECLIIGGRSFGKSIHLEADMLQNCINDYDEESLLTTFRRMHIKDRFEKVISYFVKIPYLTKFLKGRGEKSTKESITRTPFYDIHLRNGHSMKGISVGDDPLAVAIQGTHPTRRYIDEMQMYPPEAWVKFQSTRDPKGALDKFYGCCWTKGQFILTKNGVKSIEKVIVNDEVISHKGKFRKVIKTFHRLYQGDVFSLKAIGFNFGEYVTPDHRFLVCDKKNIKNVYWLEVCKIDYKKHLVAIPKLNFKEEKLSFNLGVQQPAKGPKYKDDRIRDIELDSEWGYLLGLWLAEGICDNGIDLKETRTSWYFSQDEKIIAEKICKLIESKKIGNAKLRRCRKLYKPQVSNKFLCQWIRKNFSHLAKNKRLPDWVYSADKVFLKELLDSYIIGDGRIKFENKQLNKTVTSISKELLIQFQIIALLLGEIFSFHKPKTTNKEHYISNRLVCSKNQIYRLRKIYEYKENSKFFFLRILNKKQKKYKGFVYNIEVEKDHSYFNGLLVSHNCDGRVNTPYFEADKKLKKFRNKKFHVPRLMEQWFNQEDKFNLIQTFGSENANEYLQQVLAEWGEPEWGVWDEQIIRHCIDKTEIKKGSGILANHMAFSTISAKDYVGATPGMVIQNLKIPNGITETILAIDAGYSEPTVVLPFMRINHKWHLYNIVELRDRMIPDDQTEIIDYIADQYQAMTIPIDCTSADGRAVASSLQNPKREEFNKKGYDKRVVWVEFNKYFEIAQKMDEKDPTKEIPIKEKIKDKTTTVLRQMFANQDFFLYYAEDLLAQFNAESQKRNVNGAIIIKTPDWVHIPEAFRCFAAAYYQKYMVIRPEDTLEPVADMAHAESVKLGVELFTHDKDDDDDLPIDLRR